MGSPVHSEDLASLFDDPPAGPSQPMAYRQGIIQTFNQNTLENTVLVGDSILTNLPVLGVAEAASYVPNTVVGIHCVGSSWSIVGRFAIPNTADATNAISLLSNHT